MSTRSVIAVKTPKGWRGRYCQNNGYPTGNGAELVAIVTREGYKAAVKQLTKDRYGWAHLDTDTAADDDQRVPAGDRFVAVAAYGVAYTTVDGMSEESDWITNRGISGMLAWAYALDPQGVTVYRAGDGETWVELGHVSYTAEDADEQMGAIEDLAEIIL